MDRPQTITADRLSLALARAFADNVLAALGQETVDEVIKRNSAGDPSTCATHDFADANELMLEAMTSLDIEFDPADEKQAALTDRAWTLAKAAGFDPRHPALQDRELPASPAHERQD